MDEGLIQAAGLVVLPSIYMFFYHVASLMVLLAVDALSAMTEEELAAKKAQEDEVV